MNCERVARENLVERYLTGKLVPELQANFEQHYFECEACAKEVTTSLAIVDSLRELAPEIREEMAPAPAPRNWWAGAAAIAAGILVVLGVSLLPHTVAEPVLVAQGGQAVELAELGRIDAPAYPPPAFRGIDSAPEQLFRKAMESYLQRDYAHAIPGLRAALNLDPRLEAPRFFLGACYLLTGEVAQGVAELERAASQDSPFAEEARFDLAKAYLLEGRRDDAIHVLGEVTAMGGEYAARARELMLRVASVQ